jgi:hypothetical protein
MAKKERQQLLGLEILKPDDPTLWKRALKSELGRRAKMRQPILGRRASRKLLSGILDRLKRLR